MQTSRQCKTCRLDHPASEYAYRPHGGTANCRDCENAHVRAMRKLKRRNKREARRGLGWSWHPHMNYNTEATIVHFERVHAARVAADNDAAMDYAIGRMRRDRLIAQYGGDGDLHD